MANAEDYTQEDKVREAGAQDLARILILALGDTNFSGVKLLGKKTDSSFENIKSNDSGALEVSLS